MGVGVTSKGAALRLREGIHWNNSGIRSKTCGSMMRVGIIGFIYRNNPEKLIKAALFSGRITHSHPISDAASIAGAYIVKLVLDGVEPREMFKPILNVTEGISPEFTKALKNSYETAHSVIEGEDALRKLGQGWYADETFALAYFCILRYPKDYRTAVLTAVNITGDSDSLGSVVGSILRAMLGIEECLFPGLRPLRKRKNLKKWFCLYLLNISSFQGFNLGLEMDLSEKCIYFLLVDNQEL